MNKSDEIRALLNQGHKPAAVVAALSARGISVSHNLVNTVRKQARKRQAKAEAEAAEVARVAELLRVDRPVEPVVETATKAELVADEILRVRPTLLTDLDRAEVAEVDRLIVAACETAGTVDEISNATLAWLEREYPIVVSD